MSIPVGEIAIDLRPIVNHLRGLEGITESILETLLDFLCGRFQGVIPNISPTTQLSATGGASDEGIIGGRITITFSNDCVAAALTAVNLYRNRDRVHRSLPLKVEVGQLYPHGRSKRGPG